MNKRKGIKNPKPRQQVYIAPSGKDYPARVLRRDYSDRSVYIELEWTPGKWIPAWVGFGDVKGVRS